MRRSLASVVCALAFGAGLGDLHAQSSQGGLRGTVKDQSGVIPGVTVTLLNEATNVARETVTNSAGEFSLPAVDPGTYTVRAGIAGFKKFERKGVVIGTQQFPSL